jgi:precorrin-4/cobalt-precorrin-4 C11-methyltransferase
MDKVRFVGAGPGAADLVRVRGSRLLGEAGAILYAGSPVSRAALHWASQGYAIADDGMDLGEIRGWLTDRARRHETRVGPQTGDPGIHGAPTEMAGPLDRAGIRRGRARRPPAMASAAGETSTLPEVT